MITSDLIYIISTWLLPVLIAITFHEAAHGYARFTTTHHAEGAKVYGHDHHQPAC
jgi:hypothetical protein